MVGVLDRPELANALHRAGIAPEIADRETESADETAALMELPVYAAISVKQRAAAAIVLTYLRGKFAGDAKFDHHGEYRGQSIVRASVDREVSLYYTLSDHALYVALQPWVIETLLDEEQAGGLPRKPATDEEPPGQATFEVKATPNGGLVTALQWLFEREANADEARHAAETLLIGAPSTRADRARYEALSLAYLGAIPFTIDAKPFELRASGASDPLRGNPFERSYPNLPVVGSPAAAVLDALAFFRTQVGFDREPMPRGAPEERSLSVRMTIGRR
jgi:hypothetical protein